MANHEHLDLLKQGVAVWNQWRNEHQDDKVDLSYADLSGAYLSGAVLEDAYLFGANLYGANLRGANLGGTTLLEADLRKADCREANLSGALIGDTDLRGANFSGAYFLDADLGGAYLEGVNLSNAYLQGANLNGVHLNGANLKGTDLKRVNLTSADLSDADLSGCFVYGISAWNIKLENTIQPNLIITPPDEPTITVDNLEVAQFIYLLLNNKKIRDVIDTITSKVVLILGHFTPKRKTILDALRDELRKHDYLPVLFDFERPANRDFTETVRTLAHMSRFIIADVTEPSSIPQELQAIVPDLEVPVQPILEEEKKQYAIFPDLRKHPWVFPVYLYKDQASLIASLKKEIIEPADKKARELAIEKAKRLGRP